MAVIRGCRIRDAGVGGLVQQSPAAGAHRQHPASRSRGTLLCHDGATRHGDPAKLAQALIKLESQDELPRRFLAGADAIATAEQKIAALQQQIDAYRELSSSLA